MKSLVSTGAATLVAAFLALSAAGAAQAAGAYVTNDLNMRAGPSTRHHVVSVLRAGSHVEILRCAAGSSWCEVHHRGRSGWVSARYLDDGVRRHRVAPRSSGVIYGGPVVTFEFRAGPRYHEPPPRVRYHRDRRYRDWSYDGWGDDGWRRSGWRDDGWRFHDRGPYDPRPYDPYWDRRW